MLYGRKTNDKIIKLGYRPILMVLEYIKYEHIYKNISEKYDYKKHYEENIEVDCNTLTGIRILYINDPVGCLKVLFDIGKINRNTTYHSMLLTSIIAKNGHLNCLKYAKENGFPWNVLTYCNAAIYEHLDCLKYAKENGCPFDKNVFILGIIMLGVTNFLTGTNCDRTISRVLSLIDATILDS